MLLPGQPVFFERCPIQITCVMMRATGELAQTKHVFGSKALRVLQVAILILVGAGNSDGMVWSILAFVLPDRGFQGGVPPV